jgi:hypothetical protein
MPLDKVKPLLFSVNVVFFRGFAMKVLSLILVLVRMLCLKVYSGHTSQKKAIKGIKGTGVLQFVLSPFSDCQEIRPFGVPS